LLVIRYDQTAHRFVTPCWLYVVLRRCVTKYRAIGPDKASISTLSQNNDAQTGAQIQKRSAADDEVVLA
jgi:hypothetical protein